MFRSEQFFKSFYGKIFHNIGVLTTAVVAAPRITLSILISEQTRTGGQYRLAGVVLGRDQDYAVALAPVFGL